MLVSEITARFAVSHPGYPASNVEILQDVELVLGACSSKDNRDFVAEIVAELKDLESGTTTLVMPRCCNQYNSRVLEAIKARCPKGITLITPEHTPDWCDRPWSHHQMMPWLHKMGLIRIKEDLFPW